MMDSHNNPESGEERQPRGSPSTTFRFPPEFLTRCEYSIFLITADTKVSCFVWPVQALNFQTRCNDFFQNGNIGVFPTKFSEPEMAFHFLQISRPEMLKTFPTEFLELSNFISEFSFSEHVTLSVCWRGSSSFHSLHFGSAKINSEGYKRS